jgi:hypothetical protein
MRGSAASATPAVLKQNPSTKPQRHELPRRTATQPARSPVAIQVSGGKQIKSEDTFEGLPGFLSDELLV